MTIEEKAKAYDRVSKEVKDFFEGRQKMYSDVSQTLEYLFPELKESEDERIRKEIIEYIKTGTYHKDWIAWLEKQAQNPTWSEKDKNMLKWVIGYLENKMLNTPISEERTACKNAVAWLEEKLKDEQKPNPCDGCINRKGCINCENGELRETEQKPVAWSEEDDKMYNRIVSFIPQHLTAESYTACINWLKSLKDRIIPQQKQEWGEEDESMRIRCIGILGKCYIGELPTKVEEELNWLKSLRPKNMWKPSAFHLECITDAISMYKGRGINAIGLKEILDELKKLREG